VKGAWLGRLQSVPISRTASLMSRMSSASASPSFSSAPVRSAAASAYSIGVVGYRIRCRWRSSASIVFGDHPFAVWRRPFFGHLAGFIPPPFPAASSESANSSRQTLTGVGYTSRGC